MHWNCCLLETALTRPVRLLVLTGACALTSFVITQADTLRFTGELSGANENPPVPSMGTGSTVVHYDSIARTMSVDVSWSGLTGTTTVAHIHCCVDPPETIGVATFPGTFPGFPSGVTSGTYSGSWDLSDPASYTSSFLTNFGGGTADGAEAALVDGLLAGRAYLNIHSSFAGGGEIRDFLTLVPEPETAALAAGVLAALAVYRFRRFKCMRPH
jgi:hypothetical protein